MKRMPLALALFAATAMGVASCDDSKGDGGGKSADSKGKSGGDKGGGDKGGKKKGGYEGGPVADGGKITGKITYKGDKQPGTVKVTKDESACIHNDKPDDDLVLAEGNVANVLIWLPEIKKGKPMEIGDVEVNNLECKFIPRVAVGEAGAQILAKNSDAVLHNTHLYLKEGNKNLVNIPIPNKDQVIKKKLKKPGLIDIKCDAHEWMQGWLFAAANPYVVVTGADGSFELADVPAGDHKVKIWHEVLGEHEATVTVSKGGDAKLDHEFS